MSLAILKDTFLTIYHDVRIDSDTVIQRLRTLTKNLTKNIDTNFANFLIKTQVKNKCF